MFLKKIRDANLRLWESKKFKLASKLSTELATLVVLSGMIIYAAIESIPTYEDS